MTFVLRRLGFYLIAFWASLTINFLLPHPDGTGQRSQAFLEWGWRVPFLFSAVMVIIGLWVRLRLVGPLAPYDFVEEPGWD